VSSKTMGARHTKYSFSTKNPCNVPTPRKNHSGHNDLGAWGHRGGGVKKPGITAPWGGITVLCAALKYASERIRAPSASGRI
jgi:hypothetical protein